MNVSLNLHKLLIFVALVCFIAAAIGFEVGSVAIGWVGLAFYAAASLVRPTP